MAMKLYIIDEDGYQQLKDIAADLHSGSDSDREYGHRLWYQLKRVICEEVTLEDPSPVAAPVAKELEANAGNLHLPKLYKMAMDDGLRLRLDGCKIHLSQAGILSVVNPVFGEGYYGRFDIDGYFKPTKDCTPAILGQLLAVEKEGVDAAIAIGKLTGTCCVCGRLLTAEDSVAAGIGPICGARFNKAYGSNATLEDL